MLRTKITCILDGGGFTVHFSTLHDINNTTHEIDVILDNIVLNM